jgi:beta-lactamase family protein
MASAGRAIAGVSVTVVAALVLFLAFRGHGAAHPPAAAGTGPASTATAGPGSAGTGPDGAAAAPPSAAGAGGEAPAGSAQPSAPARASSSPARSGTVAPARHADPLSAAAASYAAGRSGTVLGAVYDIRTGQSWRLGDGQAQPEASVVKLDILETLLARPGGTPLPPGEETLSKAMIEDSDNDSATSLWDEADGAAGIGAYNDRAGLTRTTPSACVTCAGFRWPGWGLTTSVPYDQITLLKQLVTPGPRPLLSAAARSYALSLMENVTPDQRWGVSGGVPAGVTVALKNGWLPLDDANTNWQVNSVGWVSGGGRDYLIAVFSTGNPTEQYGIDTISALSSIIWTAMR